jgi:hypothetical protein
MRVQFPVVGASRRFTSIYFWRFVYPVLSAAAAVLYCTVLPCTILYYAVPYASTYCAALYTALRSIGLHYTAAVLRHLQQSGSILDVMSSPVLTLESVTFPPLPCMTPHDTSTHTLPPYPLLRLRTPHMSVTLLGDVTRCILSIPPIVCAPFSLFAGNYFF